MAPLNGYIKSFLILLVAVIIAIMVGAYASKIINPYQQHGAADQNTIEQNDYVEEADYIASPPSFGPIIQTLPITVTYQPSQDMASAIVNAELLERIETKQDVILFDKDDYVLPLGGIVSEIAHNDDGKAMITITLPEGTKTEFLSNKMEIITKDIKAQKRLPLASLLQDENYYYFVWTAYQSDETSDKLDKVKKLYIDVGQTDPDYFVELGETIESYTPIILNPDKKLDPDKKYNITYVQFEGRHHNPIKQALLDYEAYKRDQHNMELQETIDDCASGKGPLVLVPGASTLADGTRTPKGGGCGISQTDPLQIFNSLINQNSPSGCGISSCPQ